MYAGCRDLTQSSGKPIGAAWEGAGEREFIQSAPLRWTDNGSYEYVLVRDALSFL